MDIERLRTWLETKAELSFSRSSGPGGQNVNKVNSAITIHVNLRSLEGIGEAEQAMLFTKLKNRINVEGELVIRADDTRSQLENRKLALERTLAMIVRALHREKPRRATKPTKASKERRIVAKKMIAVHKLNRSRPDME